MKHKAPIYLADISVDIIKETNNKTRIKISSFSLKKEVLKGCNFNDLLADAKRNINRLRRKDYLLPKSEFKHYYEVKNISLLIQLGTGIWEDNDVCPVH